MRGKSRKEVRRKRAYNPCIISDEMVYSVLQDGSRTIADLAKDLNMNTPYAREKLRRHVTRMFKSKKVAATKLARPGMGRKPMAFFLKQGKNNSRSVPSEQ